MVRGRGPRVEASAEGAGGGGGGAAPEWRRREPATSGNAGDDRRDGGVRQLRLRLPLPLGVEPGLDLGSHLRRRRGRPVRRHPAGPLRQARSPGGRARPGHRRRTSGSAAAAREHSCPCQTVRLARPIDRPTCSSRCCSVPGSSCPGLPGWSTASPGRRLAHRWRTISPAASARCSRRPADCSEGGHGSRTDRGSPHRR